jgi:hypothetical protein
VGVVDGVEAQQRRQQPPVGERDLLARQIPALRQQRVETAEGREHPAERLVVGLLGAREAGAVHAVLKVGVDPLVELLDLGAQVRRVQVVAPSPLGEEAHDVGRLVVHDAALVLVPHHRHADAPVVVVGVGLAQEAEAVDLVGEAAAAERPAALVAVGVQQ